MVEAAKNERRAKETYDFYSTAQGPGRAFVDPHHHLLSEDGSDLFRWGDRSRIILFSDGAEPRGLQFCTQRGRKVYLLAVVGLDLANPELLRMILTPKLMKLEQYEP
jgi:hypothetical protein